MMSRFSLAILTIFFFGFQRFNYNGVSVGLFGLTLSGIVKILGFLYSHITLNLRTFMSLFLQIMCFRLSLSLLFWDIPNVCIVSLHCIMSPLVSVHFSSVLFSFNSSDSIISNVFNFTDLFFSLFESTFEYLSSTFFSLVIAFYSSRL